ncbi:choice-of-anchor A family protein [Xylanimonas ulmi]|uniref:Choice-of-anchor A domain-containing protein n=1 Tax=Xylanimonas ulmi TaxID=228973 RepID=A0A4Q7M6W3_9MICO|nr:choice-of-anchor A family protein [Xylanibacterium ulmi]RZS61829.1 choice-of-anchor A domain-containing protein [Xylanibacterium ulmi]
MPARPDAASHTPKRSRRPVSALLSASLGLAGSVALVAGPWAQSAAAAPGACPAPGDMPGISQLPPTFIDSNVSVFAGGDFLATGGAAESEGLHVIRGAARFEQYRDSARTFNLGTVGAGSQITPPGGHLMLQVGGDVDVDSGVTLSVGARIAGGGAVNVGGSVVGGGDVETNGGALTGSMGAGALAPWHDYHEVIKDASQALAAAPDTGRVDGVNWDAARIRRFTSTDPSNTTLQAFTIDAAELTGATELQFIGIPQDAPVVVNVVGHTDVTLALTSVTLNGSAADQHATLGDAASRILWNFASTARLTMGGTSEWIGSVLAPQADVVFHTSANGRVLVGGDLTTRGEGHEFHAFPWIGPAPFGCVDGSFAARKTLTGVASAAVPPHTVFTLKYTHRHDDGATHTGTLRLPLDGTLVSGPMLRAGAVVTLREIDIPQIAGVTWADPVLMIDGEPQENGASFVIGENTIVSVVVVNTAHTDDADKGAAVPEGDYPVADPDDDGLAGYFPTEDDPDDDGPAGYFPTEDDPNDDAGEVGTGEDGTGEDGTGEVGTGDDDMDEDDMDEDDGADEGDDGAPAEDGDVDDTASLVGSVTARLPVTGAPAVLATALAAILTVTGAILAVVARQRRTA